MLGDPGAHSLGKDLQEFIVVLAGAAPLPRGLGRDQLPDHSRTSVLVAGSSKFAIRNSQLREDLRSSPPTRHAVVPEKRRVPGRIRVADLEGKTPVQGRRRL